MVILPNPQIAELIEEGCAFKSDFITNKNKTKQKQKRKKEVNNYNKIITTYYNKSQEVS